MFAYFFVLGVASATWAARLPAIKEDLHLSDARLGLVLFAVPAGDRSHAAWPFWSPQRRGC